jgi:hypothetical protein
MRLRLAFATAATLAAAPPAGAVLDEPAPAPGARPTPVAPGGPGELVVVPGRSAVLGSGSLLRFAVEVEGGLRIDRRAFAARVTEILSDRRSWGRAVQRVGSGPVDVRVTLASPATTNRLCAPLLTNGIFSCGQGGRAVLNVWRWRTGADAYSGDIRRYRIYMVNHEVGHLLGLGHTWCPASGALAPVMMQQTKGVAPCRPNPWPLPSERGF